MITKEELNQLGFKRLVGYTNSFAKCGWWIWAQEVEPGNVYNKVGISKDDHGKGKEPFEYFYDFPSFKEYFEYHEGIRILQRGFALPSASSQSASKSVQCEGGSNNSGPG